MKHRIKSILLNRNTTSEELVELIKNNYIALRELINDTPEILSDILNDKKNKNIDDFVLHNMVAYLQLPEKILWEILKTTKSNDVLCAIAKSSQVTTKILETILISDVLKYEINWPEYCVLTAIVKSSQVTPKILEDILEHPRFLDRILYPMVKSSQVTPKIWNKILKKLEKVTEGYYYEKVLIAMIQSSQITVERLMEILEHPLANSTDVLCAIVKSSQVTLEILKEILKKILVEHSLANANSTDVLCAIVKSSQVTPEILMEILQYEECRGLVLKNIAKFAKVTPNILNEILKLPSPYRGDHYTLLIDMIKSSKVTSETLMAILQTKYTSKDYLLQVYREDYDDEENIVKEIIKCPAVTSEIFMEILKEGEEGRRPIKPYMFIDIVTSTQATPEVWQSILSRIESNQAFKKNFSKVEGIINNTFKAIAQATDVRNQRIQAYIQILYQPNRTASFSQESSICPIYKLSEDIIDLILEYIETNSCVPTTNKIVLLKCTKAIFDSTDKLNVDFRKLDIKAHFQPMQFSMAKTKLQVIMEKHPRKTNVEQVPVAANKSHLNFSN